MSVRVLILVVVVALIVGVAVGHYALPRGDASAISGRVEAGVGQEDPAKAASRAMTFTQPKAPAR
ncbi:hypothetical protein [Nitrobacter vulgaris]|uniref:Uncharacterized protein n=1 Tax=Nitrobacter vulgaris TaxID=29421 RepID=A0A1V4HU47_NITVU|nr:hypothetical protein [Nitrobacter vulgaris]OPH81375.1 hypothetical protein B2M20_17995 [Nitrobacter vulgaris]